jgi:CheY-like chemotaxis protein
VRPDRILVLEDEMLVALDIAKIVSDVTSGDVLVAHNLEAATRAMASGEVDLALLDVTLPDGTCFDVADRLLEHGNPYVFVTAYPRTEIPFRHRAAPILEKPYRETDVRAALSTVLVPPPLKRLGSGYPPEFSKH